MPEQPGPVERTPLPQPAEDPDRPAAAWGQDTASVLADFLESLAAIGRSMQEEFAPQRFLDDFSARIRRLIPHDRLVFDLLDEDGQTLLRGRCHFCHLAGSRWETP